MAQQGGDGNEGNGAIFQVNPFGGFDLGIPGGPGCASVFQPGDSPQEWVRNSPNGDFTVHVVDHAVTVYFWEAGATGNVWNGPGKLTLHYTADAESVRFNWRVMGTVTNPLTGETRQASCHAIVANNDLKKFDLELTGG
jgi:hypothetical protein